MKDSKAYTSKKINSHSAEGGDLLQREDAKELCHEVIPKAIGKPVRCYDNTTQLLVEARVDARVVGGQE